MLYLEDRLEAGARPSTLRVAAAAIARNHTDAGLDLPVCHRVARLMLDELKQDESPGPSRGLPQDLDCYLVLRTTAQEPRPGRGGRLKRTASCRNRGVVDIVIVDLMRDAGERGCRLDLGRRPAHARRLRPRVCLWSR